MKMYVPDNYDAYSYHEAQQEAMLAKCPVCDSCGESIQDDYLYDVNGDVFCESCMNDLFRKSTEDYEGE